MWKHFIKPSDAQKIAIVAHSAGGGVTTSMLDKYENDFKKRVYAIAFTDAFGHPQRSAKSYFKGVKYVSLLFACVFFCNIQRHVKLFHITSDVKR